MRLRYNALSAELAADIDTVATAVTFAESLKEYGQTAIANIAAPDYLPLYRAGEVVYLTAYDNVALTGTISRGQEGSTAVAHEAADMATTPFKHGWTKVDPGRIPIRTVTGTAYTVVQSDAGKILRFTDAALVTVTLPVSIEVESIVHLLFVGAAGGAVQDDGTSIVNGEGTVAQHGEASCLVTTTSTWNVQGTT